MFFRSVCPPHEHTFQPGLLRDRPERGGNAETVSPLVHQRFIGRVAARRADDRVRQPAVDARGLLQTGHAIPDARADRLIQGLVIITGLFRVAQGDLKGRDTV